VGRLKHTADVMHAAFSHDGKLVATASLDQTVRIWSVPDGTLLKTLELGGAALSVAFGPDNRLVTASKDGSARIYQIVFLPDSPEGKPQLTLDLVAILKHQGEVRDALFNQDGSRILTISYPDLAARSSTGPLAYRLFSPRQWPVAPAKGSQADLRTFCELISSRVYDESLVGLRLLQEGTDLEARWARFRQDPSRRPVEWDTLPPDPAALWARLDDRAKEHEAKYEWFAASWYLTKLIQHKGEAELYWRRGRAFSNLPQWRQQALSDLDRATELDPKDWRPLQSLARLHEQAHPPDWKQARANYDKILRLKQDDWQLYRSRGVVHEKLNLWKKAIDDYTTAMDLVRASNSKVNADGLWPSRARARAELSDWTLAEQDFSEAVRRTPGDPDLLNLLAVVQLAKGDRVGYRKTCKKMEGLVGTPSTSSHVANQVAWTGALDPNSGIEGAKLVQLAEQAVRGWRQQGYLNTLGAAQYRAGEYDKAIPRLEESLAEARRTFLGVQAQNGLDVDAQPDQLQKLGAYGVYSFVADWLFLAMANQKNGKLAEARNSLDRAILLLDQATPGKDKGQTGYLLPWNHRFELNLLRGEAENLVRPKSP
jgi:tetratricopeptide (TPR) repeat protein